MHNSKITILIKIVVFVAIFVLIVTGLNAIFEPSTPYAWQVLPFIYQHHDIDTVFVGSSVVFDSNIPLAVNETSGLNVCNLSTPLQTMMASYYLLQDALSANDIKHVVLNLDITRFQINDSKTIDMIQSIEFMRLSLNKLSFLANGFSVDDYPAALLRCYRRRFAFKGLLGLEVNSSEAASIPKSYVDEIIPYLGRGYSYLDKQQKQDEIVLLFARAFDTEKIRPENTQYLQKIIDLCKERQIDLILMSSPRLAANIFATGNYSDFHTYIQALADQNHLPYWDFVYIKPEYLTVSDTMFIDDRHANYRLSLPLSKLVGQMLREHIENTFVQEKYFYQDFDGFRKLNHRITALTLGALSAEKTVKAKAIMDEGIQVEYRFLLSKEEQTGYTVIQDWSASDTVDLSAVTDSQCWLMAETRQAGTQGDAVHRKRSLFSMPTR